MHLLCGSYDMRLRSICLLVHLPMNEVIRYETRVLIKGMERWLST